MSKPELSGATESPSYTVHLTRWAQQYLQSLLKKRLLE